MAINEAYFLHKNCPRLTRFNLLTASGFIYKYTSRCIHFSTWRKYCVSLLKTRQNGFNYRRGVADRRQNDCANNLVFVLRRASTGARAPAGGESSKFQKFRKIMYDFYLGGKHLYQDVKLTWEIRRNLRASSWNYDVLHRKELWKMVQTQKNIKKTLPIVALSCLPVIGYLGPIIGFLRPRQFLSTHFWTAQQKVKFIDLDNKERAICSCAIFQIINEETKKLENHEQQLLHKITSMADVSDVNIDLTFQKSFSAFSSGVFSLENLQRTHLQKLCSFWIMRSLWPSFVLKRNLKNEMVLIHKDDVALGREGVETLNEEQLKEACHVRGLDTSNTSIKDLQSWLQSWLDVSKNVSENETSYLAHYAVFKTMNSQGTSID